MKMSLEIFAGIVGSDGHVENNQAVIRIINKDRDFLEKIVVPLIEKLTGKRVQLKQAISGFGKPKFVIAFTSQEIWKILQEKFSIPKGRKSDAAIEPKLETNKEKMDFLLGWFAGDGSVTVDRDKPKLEIWSKSKETLEWFKKVLQENEIESRIFSARRVGKFILRIGKQADVKLFHKKFTIPHPTKEQRLASLLS